MLTGVVPVRGLAAGKDPEELSSGRAWRAALVWAGASISGNHLDVVGGRGGDDGAEVVLGVVAGHPGQRGRPGGADGGGPGDLGQAGVVDGVALGPPLVGDGNAPALVVGEVEVQLVELVVRHGLNGVQHLGHGDEGPGGVQHEAPVGVPGESFRDRAGTVQDLDTTVADPDQGPRSCLRLRVASYRPWAVVARRVTPSASTVMV